MKKRTTVLLLLLAVIIIVALVLYFVLRDTGKEKAPVKLGSLLPLTGALSEFGQGFRLVGDLVVEQFAEAGFPIVLKYGDTETSAIPGVEAARMLVDIERVVAIIGAAASGVTMPVAESVAIPSKVPIISNASTAPVISVLPADEGQDFLFRTAPSDALQGVVLGQLAIDEGYKNTAVFWINNPYGQGLLDQFRESFEHRGGKIVAAVPHDEKPAPTYVSELKKLMESSPDAMLALGYPGQATVYLKEFFEAGYNKTTDLLFCDGTKSVKMPKALGPENLAGYLGTVPGTVGGESLERFKAGYEGKYGEVPPLPYMDTYYDAVVVAALAAAAADARGMEITPINVRDMLREVANPPGEVIYAGVDGLRKALDLLKKGKSINYEGAAGSVDFNSRGDVTTPIDIFRYIKTDPFIETVETITDIPEK